MILPEVSIIRARSKPAFLTFQSVCSHLLQKLEYYGIRYSTLSQTTDFLQDCTQDVVLDSHSSSESPVTSGVTQGTVIGPCCSSYTYDLPSRVQSTVWMFADDCLLYREICSMNETKILQGNLDSLPAWEQDCLMEFNPSKCEAITFTKKTKPVEAECRLHNVILTTVTSAKYLGILISSKLSWNTR